MKMAAKTLAAFLMIFTHIIKHRQGSSLSGRTFSPAAFSVIYYGSITDTVITETSGGDRMGTTKIRTDEE